MPAFGRYKVMARPTLPAISEEDRGAVDALLLERARAFPVPSEAAQSAVTTYSRHAAAHLVGNDLLGALRWAVMAHEAETIAEARLRTETSRAAEAIIREHRLAKKRPKLKSDGNAVVEYDPPTAAVAPAIGRLLNAPGNSVVVPDLSEKLHARRGPARSV